MSTPVKDPVAPPAVAQSVAPPAPSRRLRDYGLDVRRLRRIRLIAFGVLALPLAVLALLMVKFLSMPLTQAWQGAAYDAGRYPTAIERIAPVRIVNWFEPYLADLTEGTNLLQDGDNAGAEAVLRRSLDTWEKGRDLNKPPHAECKIRNNLALAIERQALQNPDPEAKADRLFEAESIIAPCAGGGGGNQGQGGQGGQGGGGQGDEQSQGGQGNEDEQTTSDNGERISEERKKADEEAGNDPDAREPEQDESEGPGEDPGEGDPMPPGDPRKEDPEGEEPPEEAPTPSPDPEQEQQDDELENRNREANRGEGEETQDGEQQEGPNPW